MAAPDRPLLWVGPSKRNYREFPSEVQDGFGFELFLVQTGHLIRRRLRIAAEDHALRYGKDAGR